MRIIKRKTLKAFAKKYADAKGELDAWYQVAREHDWNSIVELRQVFPHADAVSLDSGHVVTIFNIKGKHYRLIVAIHYDKGRIYLREFLTHAQYSKGDWKKRS